MTTLMSPFMNNFSCFTRPPQGLPLNRIICFADFGNPCRGSLQSDRLLRVCAVFVLSWTLNLQHLLSPSKNSQQHEIGKLRTPLVAIFVAG